MKRSQSELKGILTKSLESESVEGIRAVILQLGFRVAHLNMSYVGKGGRSAVGILNRIKITWVKSESDMVRDAIVDNITALNKHAATIHPLRRKEESAIIPLKIAALALLGDTPPGKDGIRTAMIENLMDAFELYEMALEYLYSVKMESAIFAEFRGTGDCFEYRDKVWNRDLIDKQVNADIESVIDAIVGEKLNPWQKFKRLIRG